MRIRISIFILMSISTIANAKMLAFQRGDDIWIADISGRNQQFICKGQNPAISPNGDKIAFTSYDDGRHIKVIDIKTKGIADYKQTVSSYDPCWSPNGSLIAFQYWCLDGPSEMNRFHWKIGIVVSSDTSNELKVPLKNRKGDEYSQVFLNNEELLFHDRGRFVKVNIDGEITGEIPFSKHGSFGWGSSMRIEPSEDANKIMFDADVDEVIGLPDGPPSALFLYDVAKDTITRISPKGICAMNADWVSKDEVVFEGFTRNDIRRGRGDGYIIDRRIYYLNIRNSNVKVLIENASYPTSSSL